MPIHLGTGEVALATQLAAIRQAVNREAGIVNQKAGAQDPITTDLVGVLGEFAFARWANVCPDLTTHLRKGTPDAIFRGWTVDVKSTRNAHGPLYVDARPDKWADLYVLMHVEYATCEVLGWIPSKRLDRVVDLSVTPVKVPQDQLYAAEDFWRIQAKDADEP